MKKAIRGVSVKHIGRLNGTIEWSVENKIEMSYSEHICNQ